MPFRRKSRNAVSRPEKENATAADPPSPRLIRCRSDNTQRSCSELSLNKSLTNQDGAFSAEAKMSNLMQLNKALVKEIASLRVSHADACNKLAQAELGLRAENGKLQSNLSSREEEVLSLKEEKTALLVSQEQLQSSLSACSSQVENLSQELAMVKAELNQALLIEKTALAASEERLLSANCDIERLRFSSKTMNEEIIAVKEEAAMLVSEKEIVLAEKVEASRSMAEKEAALAVSEERVHNLERLLDAEQKAGLDVSSKFDTLDKEIKKLYVEKEEAIGRAIGLSQQIEEEQAQHQIALKSVADDFSRKLAEASTKVLAMEELLQQSNAKADALSLQMQEEMVKHGGELSRLQEKLNECTDKAKAMEGLLQQRISNADALNQKLKDQSTQHQLQNRHLQEKMSAMAAEMSSASAEYQKLAAKKENLHKELSRVNQKQRETNENLARERKSAADAQKCARNAERDVKQACLEREKALKELTLVKDELSQLSNEKDALLSEKQRLLEENASLEAHMSGLHSDKTKLVEHLQAVQKAHAADKQGFLAELKKMESAITDLEVDQSDLLKQLNAEKMAMAAAQESIAALESTKQALLQENFEMRSTFSEQLGAKEKAFVAAEDHISSLSDEAQKLCQLNSKLDEHVASLKEQITHKELVQNGLSAEMQKVLAKSTQMEAEVSVLSASKQALQEKLENDKNEAMEKISALQGEINGLKQAKGALIMDNKRVQEEITLLKDEKHQLEVSGSALNTKLQQTLEKLAAEKTMQAKQLSEMEQLHRENDKLAAANADLTSSIKMSESQGKHLMSEKKKKDEQHAFLSKLYADLEASHIALGNELATHKAAAQELGSNNGVLQSSIETKAKAIVALEKQLDDSVKSSVMLESQIEAMAALLRSSQEDFNAQVAALDAEKAARASLCTSLEMKSAEIERLDEQLRNGAARIAMLSSQLESNAVRQNEVESTVCGLQEELSAAHKRAAHIEEQAKANLDGLMGAKNDEIAKLKVQLNEASLKKSELNAKLRACNEKKNQLESHVKKTEVEMATAKAVAVKAEKECREAVKFEADFNEASKRVSLLEAQLTAKTSMQNELEFQVISLKNDLHAVRAASEKAEKEWKANMDAALDNANARSRALEEQLESVKKTLSEMQNNANRGQESIVSLQTQLSCLMEEKSNLEKKALSTNCRSAEEYEPDTDEERHGKVGIGAKKSKDSSDEKSKLVRLVLPVFLITTASSLVFAGIQSYIGQLEN